jgi:hypothetical protein
MVKLIFCLLFSLSANAAFINQVNVVSAPPVIQGTSPWSVSGTVSLNDINGIATAANQTTANGYLSSIDSKLTSPLIVSAPKASDGVSLAAHQVTSNSWLSSIYNTLISNFPVSQSGSWNISVISGANQLGVNTNGSVNVAGSSPVGASPQNNPVTVAGVDGGNLKRYFALETDGTLKAVLPTNYSRFNGAATTTVKSGAGYFVSVCYTTPSNGSTMTVYDNTAAAGTIIAVYTPPNGSFIVCMPMESVAFTTGLTIVTTGTGQWTVSYR